MKKFNNLEFSKNGSIGVLTLNRPKKMNSLSKELLEELIEFQTLVNSKQFGLESIRGIVINSKGDKAFSAGANIKEMTEMSPDEGREFAQLAQQAFAGFESLPFPIIACVNGVALGGGFELALACDFVYATMNSTFGFPEVTIGLIPCFGGCMRFPKIVGMAKAKELIFTGQPLSATEARDIGAINRVFSTKNEMFSSAIETLIRMGGNSGVAIACAKSAINQIHSEQLKNSEAYTIEADKFRETLEQNESQIGMTAFLEKTIPQFI